MKAESNKLRVGVDVGGTFTDFTLFETGTGAIRHHKVPSTPADPSEAIEHGVAEMCRNWGLALADIKQLSHGSTVATNMVLERRGSLTGLLTTKGFRDILEIGRQARPHLYDIGVRKPEPIVQRYLRFEIDERVGADGAVLRPLDLDQVEAAARRLKVLGVEAVAICFMHAYRRADHENLARDIVARIMPEAAISTSSDVLPEFREYERFSTTVINAFLLPRMMLYIDGFRRRMAALGVGAEPTMVHSNGGLMSLALAARHPVRTCISGPASGVAGASRLAEAAGFRSAITFDVGGTSTDVSLIVDGQPAFASDREIAGLPVRCPMIDVNVIGAGGGSIAVIDDAGALRIGPESAAAHPGPAAYGLGGSEATVTDANVVLHRLNPKSLLDGRLKISEEAARDAVSRRVAEPLGLSVEDAALGIIRIAAANMARAIRAVSTQRGHDLQGFALIPFGGAGPLHAAFVADEVGLRTILVPAAPGTLCARGILLSDMSRDFNRSVVRLLDEAGWDELLAAFRAARGEAQEWFVAEAIPPSAQRYETVLECRYLGQNHEIQVPYGLGESVKAADFAGAFHAAHKAIHGYSLNAAPVQIVNLRLKAVGAVAVPVAPTALPSGQMADAVIDERRVYLEKKTGWETVPVLRRDRMPGATTFTGPCIIEEMTSTTVVLAGMSGRVDPFGNLVLTRESRP